MIKHNINKLNAKSMKKILSFLMLLTLMPLASWAQSDSKSISLTLSSQITGSYGDLYGSTLAADTGWIKVTDGTLPNGVTLEDVAKVFYVEIDNNGSISKTGHYSGTWYKNSDVQDTIANGALKGYNLVTIGTATSLDVTARNLADAELSLATDNKVDTLTYNGKAQKYTGSLAVRVYVTRGNQKDSVDLVQDTDFKISYPKDSDYTSVGEKYVVVEGMGNYAGTSTKSVLAFVITPKSIKGVTIALDSTAAQYTGSDIKMNATVIDSFISDTLTANTDYTLSYKNNKNVGTAYVIVEGKGNYTDKDSTSFAIAQKVLTITAKDAEKEYLAENPEFGYTISGLAEGDDSSTVLKDITIGFKEISKTEGVGVVPIKPVVTSDKKNPDDYTLSLKSGYLTINPLKLTDSKVKVNLEKKDTTYTGKAITAPVTITVNDTVTLVENTDYTVAYTGDTINVSKDSVTATITGKGNFEGTTTVKYKIVAAKLTVAFNDTTRYVNDGKENNDSTLFTVTYTGLQNDEIADSVLNLSNLVLKDSVSSLHVDSVSRRNQVGVYTITPDSVSNKTYQNYDISYKSGKFTIGSAALTIAIDTTATKVYGEADPATFSYKLLDGTTDVTKDSTTIFTTKPSFKRTAGENAGTYTIEVNDSAKSSNYSFTYQNGKFTITPKELTITALDQTIPYGGKIDTEIYGNVKMSSRLVDGDVLDSLYLTLSYDTTASIKDGTALVLSVDSAKTSKNYKLTLINGKVTLEAPTDFYLYAEDADYDRIQAFDSITVANVKWTPKRDQTLQSGTPHSWEAESWNTVVLPFDVTIREISSAFGYGIVNVLDTVNTTDSSVVFKLQLTGKIAANTPFLMKTDSAVANTDTIKFTNRLIVDPKTTTPTVKASNGYKLIGVYEATEFDSNAYGKYYWQRGDDENFWAYLNPTSTNTWTIVPEAAYFDVTSSSDAKNITFYMQEADGTTTAIKAVDVAGAQKNVQDAEGYYNINGVKLNAAPTQKGIYIHNGKKFVVK